MFSIKKRNPCSIFLENGVEQKFEPPPTLQKINRVIQTEFSYKLGKLGKELSWYLKISKARFVICMVFFPSERRS